MNIRIATSGLGLLAVAGMLASFGVLPDVARAEEPTPSRVVPFGDLNLATAAGQRVLQQRLHGAARQVCAALEGQRLQEQRDRRDCIAQAIARAQQSLHRPALAAGARGPVAAGGGGR